MAESVFALPVNVEQIAPTIKQMSQADQERLPGLVPDLRQLASYPTTRSRKQAQASVTQSRSKVLSAVDNQLLSPDEPSLPPFFSFHRGGAAKFPSREGLGVG
jgi:hypothetical protein